MFQTQDFNDLTHNERSSGHRAVSFDRPAAHSTFCVTSPERTCSRALPTTPPGAAAKSVRIPPEYASTRVGWAHKSEAARLTEDPAFPDTFSRRAPHLVGNVSRKERAELCSSGRPDSLERWNRIFPTFVPLFVSHKRRRETNSGQLGSRRRFGQGRESIPDQLVPRKSLIINKNLNLARLPIPPRGHGCCQRSCTVGSPLCPVMGAAFRGPRPWPFFHPWTARSRRHLKGSSLRSIA